MQYVYLLTGRPGSGKTSLIKDEVTRIEGRAGGFYTEEIRSQGTRQGFKLITLDGEECVLAHVNIHSPYRVSKYGVDIAALERIGVPALQRAIREYDLVVIDEIGKMELFSTKFRESVSQIFESGKKVLATIMLNPNPSADVFKNKTGVNLITLTRDNYQSVLSQLLHWLEAPESLKL